MTTLNDLPRSRESFIQRICFKQKLTKLSRIWEWCTQEQAILVVRGENLGKDEYQALVTHARKGESKKESHSYKMFQKTQNTKNYYSNYKRYSCQKMGQIARNCPHIKDHIRKGNNKIHHDSSEEYVLI